MPFASKAQQRYMFATHPEVAKEMAAKTPSFAALPEKVGKGPAAKPPITPMKGKKPKGFAAAATRRTDSMKGGKSTPPPFPTK